MAAENTNELAFIIDGNEYPSPDIGSFTMDERRVMFELSGFVQEDFLPNDDETEDDHTARVTRMTRHPGFMESLMHVAYQRKHPELKRQKVAGVISRTNFVEAIEKWGEGEDDAGPPESLPVTSEHDRPSPNGHATLNASSGEPSPTSSDEPAVSPATTGTGGSITSVPESPETTSAPATPVI